MGNDLTVSVKTAYDQIKRLNDGLKFIRETDVLVGVPQETSSREGSISNAELMYIHTNGSPINRIPPRPTIEPAIQEPETRAKLQQLLKDGITQALQGNVQAAESAYKKAGMYAVSAVQKKFTDGSLAPNAPSTIRRKRKHSTMPLIDTGILRQSITFVVRKKGR